MTIESICHRWRNHLESTVHFIVSCILVEKVDALSTEMGFDDRECLLNGVEVGRVSREVFDSDT